MAMEYRHDAKDGVVMRFDRKKGVYEGYNWKEKKWQNSKNAYAAANGFYEGLLHDIDEKEAERLIKEA